MKLNQAIDEYLSWLELDKHAAQGTVKGYDFDLSRFVEFSAVTNVKDINREVLRDYQRHLARLHTGPKGNRRPLAMATRARRLIALRSFLKFAAREEWTPGDLGVLIDIPKIPERLPKPLDDDVRIAVLAYLEEPGETAKDRRDKALVLFLLSTGARISEALNLDIERYIPKRQRIIGKGDKERIVEVTMRARAAMKDYLENRTDDSPALFIGLSTAQNNKIRRLSIQGANYICRQFSMRVGIPPFHPHRLRHTLGTLLQESMGDARLTAETLGHRGLGSIAGYTKISDAKRKEAYEDLQQRGL
jgi:integrase/recombinase XerD